MIIVTDSYSNFFNHLRTKHVNIDNTRLTIGSDEGNALLNAITIAFPEENHLLCKRHFIYQNTKQKLVDDSIDKPDRRKMLDLIFVMMFWLMQMTVFASDAKSKEIANLSKTLSYKFLN